MPFPDIDVGQRSRDLFGLAGEDFQRHHGFQRRDHLDSRAQNAGRVAGLGAARIGQALDQATQAGRLPGKIGITCPWLPMTPA